MTELTRVLHVDDDDGVRDIVRIALETVGGIRVLSCSHPSEALELAEGFAPELLLLDVMLPGMDGPLLLRALRKKPSLASTVAVFMTAKALRGEHDALRAAGAIDVISKPFDPMRLAGTLKDIWRSAKLAGHDQ